MPRVNRKYYISSFLHIMVQGINREQIFKNDYYKEVYFNLLMQNSKKYNLKILAYVIMSNHSHILVYRNEIQEVSHFMHLINTKYARFYNKNEDRVGYVFRDRYKCEQIKDEKHLFNVLPYIHYNPVKAKIVNKPEEYRFSSYNNYIKNNVNTEMIQILFNTKNYVSIFNKIHEDYEEQSLTKDYKTEDYRKVIELFMKNYKINTIEIILKEKNLLLELILQLEEKTNLTDCKIAKILGIGKNRIYLLKKDKK